MDLPRDFLETQTRIQRLPDRILLQRFDSRDGHSASAKEFDRVLKQRYGRVFIDSLPPYRKTTDLADVEQFFGLR